MNAIVVDGSAVVEKVSPACKEALNAMVTIQQYVSGLDNNFVCKMVQVLADFGCKTCLEELRNLEDTCCQMNVWSLYVFSPRISVHSVCKLTAIRPEWCPKVRHLIPMSMVHMTMPPF